MAITTYTELQTAVQNWLGDTATLTSRVTEFISLAEDDINMDLRVREMEASADLTITAQTVSLPTRYAQAKRVYISGSPNKPLDYYTPADFWQRYLSTDGGTPVAFTIEGENIVLGPVPGSTYTGKILYYQKLAAFSAGADTNTVLTTRRGLYLYASLKHAALYLEDGEKAAFYDGIYKELLDKAHRADAKDRHSGGPLQMRSQNTVR